LKYIFEHRTKEYKRASLIGYVLSILVLIVGLIFSYVNNAGAIFYALFILLIVNMSLSIHSAFYGAYIEFKNDKVIIKKSKFSRPKSFRRDTIHSRLENTTLIIEIPKKYHYSFNLSYLERDSKLNLFEECGIKTEQLSEEKLESLNI